MKSPSYLSVGLFSILTIFSSSARAYRAPLIGDVAVRKSGFSLTLWWDEDPGFTSDTAVEFAIRIEDKCFAAPATGKDNLPQLTGVVDTNLGDFPNVYRDVWNYYQVPDPLTASDEIIAGCNEPFLAIGAIIKWDKIKNIADGVGNFAVGIKNASLLKRYVQYYIDYEFDEALSCTPASPRNPRVSVQVQTIPNTCTLPIPLTFGIVNYKTNCPMVLGFDECKEYAASLPHSYPLHEQLCAPTDEIAFIPGVNINNSGMCIDNDHDQWFRNTLPQMYGTWVGDCDDQNPNINPSLNNCNGPTPSCSDSIQNQGETGVDCGGPCPPCAVCSSGAKRRCWIECAQQYATGCIHAGIPPLIMGIETCSTAGQWGTCTASQTCTPSLVNACTNGSLLSTSFQCTDGSLRQGAYNCSQPLGLSCTSSYYLNWPVYDCPQDLCLVGDDACSVAGAQRSCTTRCNGPSGPIRNGTQSCNPYCGGYQAWGPCLTNDGCLN